jgi:p-hydroxybenzoate 3-monooxygenase
MAALPVARTQVGIVPHPDPGDDGFAHRHNLARLRHVASSRAAATSLAENYTGLPFAT